MIKTTNKQSFSYSCKLCNFAKLMKEACFATHLNYSIQDGASRSLNT